MTTTTAPKLDLGERLGAGATGTVVRGRLVEPFANLEVGAEVAVKRLHPELTASAAARAAFELEARAGLTVQHPNLGATLYSGEDAEGPFLVMLLADGVCLADHLAELGPLPEPLLRRAGSEVAAALAALHAAHFTHGDIKPENMRLCREGRAMLLDLGFARDLRTSHADTTRNSAATTTSSNKNTLGDQDASAARGSLAYLSPEETRGVLGSPASDMFSLGVALFELATGSHPFFGQQGSGSPLPTSSEAVIKLLEKARFQKPSRLVPQLSPLFDQLMASLLERDPVKRPSAFQVATILRDGERSEWWRQRLAFSSQSRRGGRGENASHRTPLVGREQELMMLRDIAFQARTQSGGAAVWIHGPVGMGKSRLVSDFASLERQSDHPPLYLYGRCSTIERTRPCAPILTLVQRYLRLPPGQAPGPRDREELQQLLPSAEAEAVAAALDPHNSDAFPAAVPAALATWITKLAEREPLLIFLDDLNYADRGTLEALQRAVRKLDSVPLVLVLGWRSFEKNHREEALQQLRAQTQRVRICHELELKPLSQGALRDIAEELFHPSNPILRIADVLWSRSRGNPGLLVELLQTLEEAGSLERSSNADSRYRLTIDPEQIPLPGSLDELIAQRHSNLPDADRLWLNRLAVVGGRIDPDFLSVAFAPAPRAELDALLGRLVQAGWLVSVGSRYRFARPALREAIYRSLSRDRKCRLHRAAARGLAKLSNSKSVEPAFQRAFHLRAAKAYAELLPLLTPLIEVCSQRGQPQRVYSLADWGLEALDALQSQSSEAAQADPNVEHYREFRITFLETAADSADRLGYREEERKHLDQLAEQAGNPEENPAAAARLYLLHARYALSTARYGLARGMLTNAVQFAEKSGSHELQSEALRRFAAVQAQTGELREAMKAVQTARDLAVHGPQRSVALLLLAQFKALDSSFDDALAQVDECLNTMREETTWSLPGIAASAHMHRGLIYRAAGRPRRSLASFRHAQRLARRAGERRLEVEIRARLGGLLLETGDLAEGERLLRDALHSARQIEDQRGQALAGHWLAALLYESARLRSQGEGPSDRDLPKLLSRAQTELKRATELAAECQLHNIQALGRVMRGRRALFAGELPRAEKEILGALRLADTTPMELIDTLLIHGSHALLLEKQGQESQSQRTVRKLERQLQRTNRKLKNREMRQRHIANTTLLLQAAIADSGQVYPLAR